MDRRPVTKQNPAGLTPRRVEIMGLLAAGLTNAEIAHRLVVSTGTVDITFRDLSKRGASTRREDGGRCEGRHPGDGGGGFTISITTVHIEIESEEARRPPW